MCAWASRVSGSTRSSADARLAVAFALIGVAASAAGVWTDIVSGTSAGTALLDAGYTTFMVAAGAVVALARPSNRIGWMLLVAGSAAAGGGALVTLGQLGITGHHDVPGASWYAVSGSVLRGFGWFGATLALPIWFPTGDTLPGRWRRLNRLLIGVLVLDVVGQGLAKQAQLLNMGSWHNPLSSPALNAIADPASLLMMLLAAVGLIGAIVQLIVRYRRSSPEVRSQIRLFAFAAALPIIAAPLGVAGIADGWIFQVTALPLPLAVGYAIVGKGLYDVSTAANRTLVWITISATIFAIFVVIIGGVGELVPGSHEWLRWLAAALVAAAILPLRDQLQRLVNRVTYGRWEDPQVILGALGQRLAGSADVPRLLDELTTELADSLGLTDVAITDGFGTIVAGGPTLGREEIPLVAYGRIVGSLHYAMPLDLRPGHRTMLADLASHLGAVMYAGGVTADLQRARERLVLAREEERRRLRRDLHDGLGPALAGHLLQIEVIASGVSEEQPLRQQLDELSSDIRGTVGDVRRVVEGLRPPALDEVGLIASLTQATRRVLAAAGVQSEVRGSVRALPAAVEVAAYRIVTEAATNCAKHARAQHCCIEVSAGESDLVLEIRDDGIGLGPGSSGGHGLQTMRERAEELGGTLSVDGSHGTVVRATIPLSVVSVSS